MMSQKKKGKPLIKPKAKTVAQKTGSSVPPVKRPSEIERARKAVVDARLSRLSPGMTGFYHACDALGREGTQGAFTKAEKSALRAYTGYSYTYMNQLERSKGTRLHLPGSAVAAARESFIKSSQTVERIAPRFPVIPEGITLYRGGGEYLLGAEMAGTVRATLRGEETESLIGRQYEYESIMSTSCRREQSVRFAKGAANSVLMRMTVHEGVRGIYITDSIEGPTHKDEEEVLISPHSSVVKVTGTEMGQFETGKRYLMVYADLISREEAARRDEERAKGGATTTTTSSSSASTPSSPSSSPPPDDSGTC